MDELLNEIPRKSNRVISKMLKDEKLDASLEAVRLRRKALKVPGAKPGASRFSQDVYDQVRRQLCAHQEENYTSIHRRLAAENVDIGRDTIKKIWQALERDGRVKPRPYARGRTVYTKQMLQAAKAAMQAGPAALPPPPWSGAPQYQPLPPLAQAQGGSLTQASTPGTGWEPGQQIYTQQTFQANQAAMQPGTSAPAPAPPPATDDLADIAAFLRLQGKWDDRAGDFAPLAIANTLGRDLIIHGHPIARGGTLTVAARASGGGSPLHIVYAGAGSNHYETYVGGSQRDVAADGDCLFRAVLMNRYQTTEVSDQEIADLRSRVAKEILTHPQTYTGFLSRDQVFADAADVASDAHLRSLPPTGAKDQYNASSRQIGLAPQSFPSVQETPSGSDRSRDIAAWVESILSNELENVASPQPLADLSAHPGPAQSLPSPSQAASRAPATLERGPSGQTNQPTPAVRGKGERLSEQERVRVKEIIRTHSGIPDHALRDIVLSQGISISVPGVQKIRTGLGLPSTTGKPHPV